MLVKLDTMYVQVNVCKIRININKIHLTLYVQNKYKLNNPFVLLEIIEVEGKNMK